MNKKEEGIFPEFRKSIENLIEDEDGNISNRKLLILGTMMIVLGSLMSTDAFAKHGSHVSHSSHSSHVSGAGGHGNHSSHESHVSHASHTSHSNVSGHSNSKYSVEGDVNYSAPDASSVPEVNASAIENSEEILKLPSMEQNVEMPNITPATNINPSLATPLPTPTMQMDIQELYHPSPTDKVE